jgi:N6-adenosine-specific RNA methylase IME4
MNNLLTHHHGKETVTDLCLDELADSCSADMNAMRWKGASGCSRSWPRRCMPCGTPTTRRSPDEPLRYKTILADPPTDIQQRSSRGAQRHYPLMTIEEICALRVDRLADDDSHLWIWSTNAALMATQRIIEAWGFRYITVLTWVKPQLGLGPYLRNSSEQLLFAVRGKAPILFRSQPTWIFAPVQDHSHKPEEAHSIVERCSPGPRLELFARRVRPGWDVWGDSVTCDVAL